MTGAQLREDLERLVVEALERPYSSFSATDDSETGNRYQAVDLVHRTTRGLREDRGRFLDALDLRGRKVLDLGSNLGEISRAARVRGAALVDGWEIDPYFNEVAQLVSVLTGTSAVSFYERDMADPASYDEPYDVVLAFSAFRFIAGCLDRLAAVTDVLVLETHELKGNFDERYLAPLTGRFPAFRILGESDVERMRAGGVRAVGVFARDEEALLGALAPALREGGPAAGLFAAGTRGRRVRGEIDRVELGGGALRVSGWCADPEARPDTVELSSPAPGPGGVPFGTLAVAEPEEDGRFDFACEAPLGGPAPLRVDVAAFAGHEPLGTLSWRCAAGLDREGLAALTAAHDLLEPVGRYRALSSFEAALDVSAAATGVGPLLAGMLPAAGIETDTRPERFAAGQFDLVVGHAVGGLDAGLEELRRVCRPGAYLALSTLGELARRNGEPGIARAKLLAACAPLFDVLSYVEGGVAGRHDLVVMRKRGGTGSS